MNNTLSFFILVSILVIACHCITFSCVPKRKVALTFDDGPNPDLTPILLDRLLEANVNASFFFTGSHAEQNPDIVKRAFDEGHDVGGHSYSHANLTNLCTSNFKEFEFEVLESMNIIGNITGVHPTLFRPPYGAYDPCVEYWIQERYGYDLIMWNVGNVDWYFNNATIQNQVYLASMPSSGGIITMHDKMSSTVEGISDLIGMLSGTIPATGFNPTFYDISKVSECMLDQ